MVQAILEGRKTQTRRVVKARSYITDVVDGVPYEMTEDDSQPIRCPYGQPGDVLWVRETWASTWDHDEPMPGYVYKADGYAEGETKWRPSIHMPREACRLFLRVKSVRAERLQDITEEDAIAEGIAKTGAVSYFNAFYKNYLNEGYTDLKPKDSFKSLWQSINGLKSWDANPWVWVVEFEIMKGGNP